MKLSSGTKLLLLLGYGLLLTGILLYVRFPQDKFVAFLERKIEAVFPGTEAELGQFTLRFPLVLALDKAELSAQKNRGEIITLTGLQLVPMATGLGLSYDLSAEILGGTVRSDLQIQPLAGDFLLDDLDLRTIAVEGSDFIRSLTRREIEGEFSFQGAYRDSWKNENVRELSGVLSMVNGRFNLKRPVLAMRSMEVERLEMELTLTRDILELSDGQLSGADLKAEYNGSLRFGTSDQAEALTLQGTLVPQREYLRKNPQVQRVVRRLQRQYGGTALPFEVRGTVANPNFRFGEGADRK